MSTGPNPNTTLYFGYGSNLWKQQMSLRCPTSTHLGLARLSGFTWLINARGYANVVASARPSDAVYGLVYGLAPADEARLDASEGVPLAYTKEYMVVEFWPRGDGGAGAAEPERVQVLVYIDRKRTRGAQAKVEYVYRMNMGIVDAVREGVPGDYIQRVLRRYIPKMEHGEEVERVRERAESQALEFEDES
ncbi:hypothetical protein LTR66_003296 [Elasticomyces elasticus]|nr:hypothetical protein LTR66_003296 [Elasticomyces elasticus]KAK5010587.1 hypothetical protein LTR28_008909 [Elasticomyces elasticus]